MAGRSLNTERAAWWRQHVDAWKKSDLTQKGYCKLHGLSRKSFARWRGWFKEEEDLEERKALRRHIGHRRTSAGPSVNPSPPPPTRPFLGEPQVARRRQFPAALKRQIVEETLLPGASVSAVARLYGVTPPCLFRWRKELGFGAVATRKTVFAAVEIADVTSDSGEQIDATLGQEIGLPIPSGRPAGSIEIELRDGRKLRFEPGTNPETIRQMVDTLEGRSP